MLQCPCFQRREASASRGQQLVPVPSFSSWVPHATVLAVGPSGFPTPSSLSLHFNWKINCYANLLLQMPSCRSSTPVLSALFLSFRVFSVQKVPRESMRMLLDSSKRDSEVPAFLRTRGSLAVVAQSLSHCLFRDRRNPWPLPVMTRVEKMIRLAPRLKLNFRQLISSMLPLVTIQTEP